MSDSRLLVSRHCAQVPSPPSAAMSNFEDPLEVFNRVWKSDPALGQRIWMQSDFIVGQDEFGKDLYLTNNFEDVQKTGTAYTHCELTLALKLLALPLKPPTIELGVSKGCCWPCAVLLELLEDSAKVDIVVSGTHSKTYGGWQFPEAVPDASREALRSALESRASKRILEFLRDHANTRRHSDSQYDSSGESGNEDESATLADLGVTRG